MPAPEETVSYKVVSEQHENSISEISRNASEATGEGHGIKKTTPATEQNHPLSTSSNEFIDTIAPEVNQKINTNKVEEAPSYQSQKPLLGSLNGSFTGSSLGSDASRKLKEKLRKLGQLDKAA